MRSRPLLPDLSLDEFRAATGAADAPDPVAGRLDSACWERLYRHYGMLRRWNRSVGLIGRGSAAEAPARHYGESLAALDFLPAGPCLDFGSGAGFPGLVLAACRPQQPFVLIEARQRKAAFLRQAVAAMSLERCEVAAGSWQRHSRHGDFAAVAACRPFQALTARAVDLEPWRRSLEPLLTADAVWLAWGAGAEPDSASGDWELVDEVCFAERRRLSVFRRRTERSRTDQLGETRTRLK